MKVYHLHLPRTSGVFLRNTLNLNNSISGHTFKIDKDVFEKADYAAGHYGTYPIQFAEHTFSILRNPIDRTISYFKYIKEHFYKSNNVNEVIEFYLDNPLLKEAVSNLSNKFLTGNIDFDKYNNHIDDHKTMVESGWFSHLHKTNHSEAIKSIEDNSINILYFDDPDLYSKISGIYGLKIAGTKANASKDYEVSKTLLDKIADINVVDLEIYEHFKK